MHSQTVFVDIQNDWFTAHSKSCICRQFWWIYKTIVLLHKMNDAFADSSDGYLIWLIYETK